MTDTTDKHMKLASPRGLGGRTGAVVSVVYYRPWPGVPGSRPGWVVVRCGLVQVTFTPCLVLVKPVRLTWTDCDAARDYVVSYVLSPRDLVSIPDNMYETVLYTRAYIPY